jgi:hypothetical protein
MRTSVKLITALSVAGLSLAAGSAFTASNTFTDVSLVSGYGEVVATGAAITAVSDTPLSSDNSKLDHVTFTSTTDLTDKTVSMTLKTSSPVEVVGNYACTFTLYGAGTTTITCPTGVAINGAINPLLNTFDTTGLTVVSP